MTLDIKVPSPGESVTEVQVSRWLKNDGDFIEKDEEICEIDSDKATLAVAAEQAGILRIKIKEGVPVKVGEVIGSIDTAGQKPASVTGTTAGVPSGVAQERIEKTEVPVAASAASEKSYAYRVPSPAAAKLMREQNIDAGDINGTGKDSRITKTDALNALSEKPPLSKAVRNEERKRMSPLRKKLGERLVAVKNRTAMLTTFNEADMSAIIAVRKKYKDEFEKKYCVKLGFMSFFTRAVCLAIKEFPSVNAMIDGDDIVYHHYCEIGIAVSAPKGLMVPVLRNAGSMSMAQIETEIYRLAEKARLGTIAIDEMTDGTFTITNGGIFGSMLSTPILNPPQSAILGMHNIVERPVAVNGKVEIRPIMYIALSYDHRIIDGRESVGFLVKVKEFLENPLKMAGESNETAGSLLGLNG
ncbi:MAG: 2-oxoglutarate dehydrogenase complex dihydrolipoyllysine-residue succinyltransferase [Bacteroidetes bacterium]|nr:2-oxoglutarate dehydrogenase complex dihydrolipoyllysine-residue succinyltransferase [Bacteroidota bacterium]